MTTPQSPTTDLTADTPTDLYPVFPSNDTLTSTALTDSAQMVVATGASVTLDETAGLQNATATTSPAEDANDNDILLAALPSAFAARLSALGAGSATGAALSGYTGAADNTGSNAFTVNLAPGATNIDISFTDSLGAPLNGLDSGLDTLDGIDILLYTDTDNNILLGRAGGPGGAIVFAAYIEETGSPVSGGKIWTVEYQPLKHPDASNPDDALNLLNKVFIGASQDLTFNLANAPSGQNLFLMFTKATPTVVDDNGVLRISDPTIIATGKDPANQSTGVNISTGDTINTSQAGGPTTFGTNSQMITEQEGIRFTFVTGARQDMTIPNLDQNEADEEDNIDFTAMFNAKAANFDIVQLQGGKSAVVKISAFNTAAESGEAFIDGYAGDTVVAITNVRVINNATGLVIENSDGSVNDASILISFTGGVATITGVKAGYQIEYTTAADHNRVLIENGAALDAKGNTHADFDIGGFTLRQASTTTAEIGSKMIFEDDGPAAAGTAVAGTVDEDGLASGVAGGVGDVAGEATVASGSVTGIFQSGVDVPLSFSLSSDTSGLPALSSGGVALVYSVAGDTLTAKAGAVDVFTFSLSTAGAYSFTLLKPLDHAAGNDENDITINLGSLLRASDKDGDTVTAAAEKLVITVDDDTPTAAGTAVTGTVDEDGLANGIAGGVGDVAGQATNASGSVSGIFQSGADVPLSYTLLSDTSGLPALSSGGVALTYSVLGDTLTAKAGAVDVFTFSLSAAGAYSFTLLKPLDHPAGNNENDITINLGSLLRATDSDGDTVTAAAEKLVIIVDDDTPTATGTAEAGTVDEDGLANGIAGGVGDVAGEATTASGSVTGIFQSGADVPLSYSLSSNTSGLPALSSGGVALVYSVLGDTLTAKAGAVDVFTFSLSAAGAYNFALLKPLDHPAGNNENDITLNLGTLLQATDKDGDTVTAAAEKLVITVDDDTPTANGTAVTGTVDEDGLANGIAGGVGDVAGEATVASGSVTGIFQSGADVPLSYSLSSNTSGLPALSSGGVALAYSVLGNTLTAKAGATDVFTLSLTVAGAYTFTLLKPLDHAAGNDENDITLNLGTLLQATDKDGDTVTAAADKLVITVDDDTPTLAFGNLIGTGTDLAQQGYWNKAAGADGLGAAGLDISLVNNQFTLVRPDNTTTIGTGTLVEQSPSPDGNGAYQFAGTLTGDFDNNAATANTTVHYTLTAKADGTYALDLLEGFRSIVVLSSADGSLDAGGPDPVRTLTIGTEEVVFFGANPLAPQTGDNSILTGIGLGAPDPTEAQLQTNPLPSFIGSAAMNVSTSGIGIANNNLEGNTTAGINAGDESFVVNPETLLTAMKIFIDNSVQGYDPATEELYYTIYYDNGTTSGAPIKVLAADLHAEAGNQKSFTVQWDGSHLIDAVQLTMGKGTIKVPVIQFIKETQSLASDIQLAFNATITDKDGDTATSAFDANLFANDPSDALFDFRLVGTTGERDAFNIDLSVAENQYQVTGFDAGAGQRDAVVLVGDPGATVQSINNAGNDSIVTIAETGGQLTTITLLGVDLLNTDIVLSSV
ncbi:T1SS secreted agglutinin RTX [Pseudomonas chlororaphis]|uniref:T1SS-143 repeat domain-containing protein n=2 Tax=Pseudomonas TaxID=286 RepID=UPI0039E15B9A